MIQSQDANYRGLKYFRLPLQAGGMTRRFFSTRKCQWPAQEQMEMYHDQPCPLNSLYDSPDPLYRLTMRKQSLSLQHKKEYGTLPTWAYA